MGNGLANSPLPELATVVMEMTVLPFIMSLWFHTRTLRGWLLVTLILWYEYSLRYGSNIGGENFLNLYSGTDLSQAILIFFTVLGTLSIIAALIGTFLAWVVELPDIMPFYALLPIPEITKIRHKGSSGTGLYTKNTGLHKYGLRNIPRPWIHCIVTTFLFLFTVVTPHVLYAMLQDGYGIHLNNTSLAFWVPCIFLAAGYIMVFIYFYFFPDIYVFGINKRNVRKAEGIDGFRAIEQSGTLKDHFEMSWLRVLKTVFFLAVFHCIFFLILGAVRFAAQDIDWSWITATVVLGVIFLIALVLAILFFAYNNTEYVMYFMDRNEKCMVYPTDASSTSNVTVAGDVNVSTDQPLVQSTDQKLYFDYTADPASVHYRLSALNNVFPEHK